MLAERLRDHVCRFPPLPPFPAHLMPGAFCCVMFEIAVDDVECLWPNRDLRSFRSLEMVLFGEPGDGGELELEDLGVFLPERENELNLRPVRGISTAGVETSAGPSTPVFTISFSVLGASFREALGFSV